MTAIDLAHVRHAPGQAVRPCPQCGLALVDTGDGIWSHAMGQTAHCYHCGREIICQRVIVKRMGIGLIFCSQAHADAAKADDYR